MKEVLPVAARALRLTLQPWEIRTADDFERVFTALNKDHPDGLYVTSNPLTRGNSKRVGDFVIKSRIPSVHGGREYVEAGGLMSYGSNITDFNRLCAAYVDKILRGARPADLPVEQPTKFELFINLKTAKALGIEIPAMLLARADEVIE